MGAFSRVVQAVQHPVHAAVWLAGKVNPEALYAHSSRLAARQGIKGFKFILSFDCDTEEDIRVVEDVHARLAAMGVLPVYAVPGELLEKGAKQYGRIAESGAEFVNHGYRAHCHIDPDTGHYVSSFFYDQLPQAVIVEDIQGGHEAIRKVLGREATGFRVPHFGSFQKREDLAFLYKTLQSMGYRFSTSTMPLSGLIGGPLQFNGEGLWEIPVSGCYDYPLTILDSYGFRFAPGRLVSEKNYVDQFGKLVDFFLPSDRPGLMNIYADPSQVYDWPDFFKCIQLVAAAAVGSYEGLLGEAVN
jgi:hypothetical protein